MSLDIDEKKQLVNHLVEDQVDRFLSSGSNARHRAEMAERKLIDEYFNTNDMEVTATELWKQIQAVAMEIRANEQRIPAFEIDIDWDEEKEIDVFERKVDKIKEYYGKRPELEVTVIYPWGISFQGEKPSFEVFDLSIEPTTEREWNQFLSEAADDPDSSSVSRLQELTGESQTYMRTKIHAKTENYALNKFISSIKVLTARINHSFTYQEDVDYKFVKRPICASHRVCESSSGGTKNYDTKAHLIEDRIDAEVVVDFDEIRERYSRHEGMDWRTRRDNPVFRAMNGYQDGLGHSENTDSFFHFWQVLEELTFVENHQSKDTVINKSLYSMNQVVEEGPSDVVEEIAEEVWEIRNRWVHDAGNTDIPKSHTQVTKILADALIEMNNQYLKDLDKKTRSKVLNIALKGEREIKALQKSLEAYQNIESE